MTFRLSVVLACVLTPLAPSAAAQSGVDLRARVEEWVQGHQSAVLKELVDLLSIPNVAADRPNIRRNALHLQQMLSRRGVAAGVQGAPRQTRVLGEVYVTHPPPPHQVYIP